MIFNSQEISILYIESDESFSDLLISKLKISKFFKLNLITVKKTLLEGIEFLKNNLVDIILIDVKPNIKNISEFKKIFTSNIETPVLIITDEEEDFDNENSVILELLRLGAQDYLVKSRIVNNLSKILDRTIFYSIERKKAIDQLELSQARYTSIIEDQSELICRFTPECKIIFFNNSFQNFINEAKLDIDIKLCLILSDNTNQSLDLFKDLTEDNPIKKFETKISVLDQPIYLSVILRGFFNKAGSLIELQLAARNITERVLMINQLQLITKEIKEEKDAIQAMCDVVDYHLWIKNNKGEYIFANKKVCDNIFKKEPFEILGRKDIDLLDNNIAKIFIDTDISVINSKEEMSVIDNFIINNNEYWLETNKKPIFNDNNEVILIAGSSRDISNEVKERLQQESEWKNVQTFFDINTKKIIRKNSKISKITSELANIMKISEDLKKDVSGE